MKKDTRASVFLLIFGFVALALEETTHLTREEDDTRF